MQIDLWHLDGCPSRQDGPENLKVAISADGMIKEICQVKVEDRPEAASPCFLRAPSFHGNGRFSANGRSAVREMLAGSTFENGVRINHQPVLVIRPPRS